MKGAVGAPTYRIGHLASVEVLCPFQENLK
jgi:hypothetical protein